MRGGGVLKLFLKLSAPLIDTRRVRVKAARSSQPEVLSNEELPIDDLILGVDAGHLLILCIGDGAGSRSEGARGDLQLYRGAVTVGRLTGVSLAAGKRQQHQRRDDQVR